MEIKGNVLNSSVEDKELVGKDGVRRTSKISHVLMMVGKPGETIEIVNLRGYDVPWALPKGGDVWQSPRIKKYENYDGNVAEVMV